MNITPILLEGYNMSVGEAGIVAVISIFIVMAILFIISAILSIFNVVYSANKKKADEIAEAEKRQAEEAARIAEEERLEAERLAKEESVLVEEISENNIPDSQLIAVITAAIAASLNTSTDKVIVRSIRKAGSWKNTALKENINRI